ncbi:MAG: N-acetylmuramoyl-L-alanine amidase [Spirochaetales bacterium]|nr:N-acetylmuramoyl-L-alanine amidase [Spirochaetales bacterium]
MRLTLLLCIALQPLLAGPDWLIGRPISFSAWREKATLDYIVHRLDARATSISMEPAIIVIHWTGDPDLERSFRYFDREKAENSRKEMFAAGEVNVSVHFLVGRRGETYQLMDLHTMARHTIGLNRYAIGIENAGSREHPLTWQQRQANVRLIRYLKGKIPGIRYLIGHYEYLNFENSPFFEERDPKYRSAKEDPGPLFMEQLRHDLSDLKLLNRP